MSRILQVASVQLNDLGCACVCVATIALAACSPSLNWREVHPGGSELKALLPCQPDEATRVQQIGASSQELHMLGCEAAGGLYALASTPLAPGATTAQAQELQQAWEQTWATRLGAANVQDQALEIKGADWSRSVMACGTQAPGGAAGGAAGGAMCGVSIWFARGATMYQAALYAPRISASERDAFLEGIEWQ